eukprot:305067-Pleurochrysis_carterae.AAC.1
MRAASLSKIRGLQQQLTTSDLLESGLATRSWCCATSTPTSSAASSAASAGACACWQHVSAWCWSTSSTLDPPTATDSAPSGSRPLRFADLNLTTAVSANAVPYAL